MLGIRGMPEFDDEGEDASDGAVENLENLYHGVLRSDTVLEYPLVQQHQAPNIL